MKCLVVLLLCLSAAAAIRFGYKRGKRYTYEYEGIVAHGIPEAFENDMGVRIFARAHFDFLRTGFVMLRLKDVTLATMKGKILLADRIVKQVTEDPQNDVKEAINRFLEMPVKFQFKARKLEEEIFASKTDPEWCVNIKRAIINHLYLSLRDNRDIYQTRDDEVSVAGRCKTSYAIFMRRPYYRVKRVIDFSQCTQRPDVLQHNLPNMDKFFVKRRGAKCIDVLANTLAEQDGFSKGRGTAKRLPTYVRSAAYFDYDLRRQLAGTFLIRQVTSESEHAFTMLGDKYQAGKAVGARTRQTLTLKRKGRAIPKTAKQILVEQKRGGLMFVYDDGSNIPNEAERQKNILDKVFILVEELKQQLTAAALAPEVAKTFTRVVNNLRKCNAKSLALVVKNCLNRKNIELKKVLIDALARVGTIHATATIKQLVEEGKVKEHYGRVLFGLGWIRNLNVGVMKHVMAICQHANVAGNLQHQRACWLSFGNLLNRLMWTIRTYPRLALDTKLAGDIKTFAETLLGGVRTSTDNEVKITFIKAIGNAGYIRDDVAKTMLDHVKDAKQPLHLRVQAAWALRHMARVKPILIRQNLLPLFANPMLDPELRIACYKILFNSDPSLLTCQLIAGVVAREIAISGPRSNQVVSFIASDVRSSMNLDTVDIVRASRARLILRFIPRKAVFGLFAYSKAINVVLGHAKPLLEMRINKIHGRETFIPRHLNAKTRLHLPGLSADFIEFGARIQGVHDILQPLFAPANTRPKRSLDILNYIFGQVTHEAGQKQDAFQAKLPARFSAYFKMFGSEMFYGKLAKRDILKILRDALFGDGTATIAGITFSKTGITYKQPFARAHLLTEAQYVIPTLTGIPLKLTSTIAMAAKGLLRVDVTGVPKLLTAKYEEIKATVKVMPRVALHMHHKVGVWLPVFETGVVVRNDAVVAPRLHAVVTVTQKGFKTAFPTAPDGHKLFALRSKAYAFVAKELIPGDRKWKAIDLVIRKRGLVEIPKTCYGAQLFGVAMCVNGRTADFGYLRTKRLPAFPYLLLLNLNMAVEHREDAPREITAKFHATANDAKTYAAHGEIIASGATKKREIVFDPRCDKVKMTCNVQWKFRNALWPEGCKATTTLDTSAENKVVITHKHGEYTFNSKIRFENEGKLMRIVNTWNKMPNRIRRLVYAYHPQLIALLHRYFAIDVAEQVEKKCEIHVKLYNKFTADIFVDTPTLRLRRINQLLPIALEKFPNSRREIQAMIDSRYGTCHVKGNNYLKTTDNVVINEKIPGTCPVVLARDARDAKNPLWKILLKLTKQGRQNVIVVFKDKKIMLTQDMKVMVNGQEVKVAAEMKLPGILIRRIAGKLFVQAEAGFQCLFDGFQTVALFMPWWHNRVHGACGNNDGEQWTDMITPGRTFVPETMTREFVREWVMGGHKCQDKVCKLQARHRKLTQGAPVGQVCFTSGRFLRCMAKCRPLERQTMNVAYHCLPADSKLIARIMKGDRTVDLANRSVDVIAAVTEHHFCKCQCA